MIYLHVTYTMPKENRDSYIRELIGEKMSEMTKKERGCHAYDFSVPLDRDDQVFLKEIWEDDALEGHKNGANIKKMHEIAKKYGIKSEIKVLKGTEISL